MTTNDRRRFPYSTAAFLLVTVAALFYLGHLNSRYCTFGFGGFQCNAPLAGLGGLLAAAIVALLAIAVILAITVLWLIVKWRRHNSA